MAALTAFQGAMPTPICPTPSTPDLAGVISVCQGWGPLCGPGTNGRLKMRLKHLYAPQRGSLPADGGPAGLPGAILPPISPTPSTPDLTCVISVRQGWGPLAPGARTLNQYGAITEP